MKSIPIQYRDAWGLVGDAGSPVKLTLVGSPDNARFGSIRRGRARVYSPRRAARQGGQRGPILGEVGRSAHPRHDDEVTGFWQFILRQTERFAEQALDAVAFHGPAVPLSDDEADPRAAAPIRRGIDDEASIGGGAAQGEDLVESSACGYAGRSRQIDRHFVKDSRSAPCNAGEFDVYQD